MDKTEARSGAWLSILDNLGRSGKPVYLKGDPQTSIVQRLHLPRSVRVGNVTKTPDGDRLDVELIVSQARHFVSKSNPDFQQLQAALLDAQHLGIRVLVTETLDKHEIIDVRPDPDPTRGASLTLSALGEAADIKVLAALPLTSEISEGEAAELFWFLSNADIPFNYPDDGCHARAHKMRRLLIEKGFESYKIWLYGDLQVDTVNHPDCGVLWTWHVAPTLRVRTGPGSVELRVIDPSLFTEPVPEEEWIGVQNDPEAIRKTSSSAVWYRPPNGVMKLYDSDYSKTEEDLEYYRLVLLDRIADSGPPPYPCP